MAKVGRDSFTVVVWKVSNPSIGGGLMAWGSEVEQGQTAFNDWV